MIVDANAYLGPWAFRKLPVTDPDGLLRLMDRAGIDKAVVSSAPAVLYRNCAAGNAELSAMAASHGERMLLLTTVNPAYPGWEGDLEDAIGDPGVVGIRVYPEYHGVSVESEGMKALAGRCADAGLPVFLAAQFEDWRQRHFLDSVPDLSGEHVRFLVRETHDLNVVVTNAGSPLIQEIYHGLDANQGPRVLFDNTFLWGPPDFELQHLVDTIGAERFVFGSHIPFRIPESSLKKIESLEIDPPRREGILGANLLKVLRRHE